jgi:hypothetical protein
MIARTVVSVPRGLSNASHQETQRVSVSLAAAPWDVVVPPVRRPVVAEIEDRDVPKVCRADGCGAALAARNTTGLCQVHVHDILLCRCKLCLTRRGVAA